MPESVISVQAFLNDIETDVDAALSTELTSKFGDIQVEVIDNVQAAARQFRISLPQETGAAAIASPYQIKVFAAPNEATAKGELDAFVAANPTYFVSQVQYDYTFQSPNQSERCIFFIVYNTSLTDGRANWAGSEASGSGSGGGGSDGDFTWEFDSDITDSDPGAGKFKFNNADPSLATFIYADYITADGLDVQNFLAAIGTGARITSEDNTDPTAIAIFETTSTTTDGTGYYKIPVTNEAVGAGSFAAGQDVAFNFVPAAAATSPGGADTQVQFNDAGAFGGDPDLTFDKTTGAAKSAGVELVAGLAWVEQTGAPTNNWNMIIFAGGLFVAVANTGSGTRITTSSDGVIWDSHAEPATNGWRALAYGNGRYVAVATSGVGNRVMTSEDGITWTIRTSAADNNWENIVYANGLFVAVSTSGVGNRVMTSPDGITWTIRTSAADNNWRGLAWGADIFVAVSDSGVGNRVMTSPDGITWTIRTSASDNNWNSVVFANGLFVAVGETGTGNRVMTSPDGITWTSRVSAADLEWNEITYGDGLFVAVSRSGTGNRVMTSPDGITWTSRVSAADNIWVSVAYGNGMFASIAITGTNRIMTSGVMDSVENNASPNTQVAPFDFLESTKVAEIELVPGLEWTTRTSTEDNTWVGVAYGNGIIVAIASSGTNRIMRSLDGVNWTAHAAAEALSWTAVTYGNGLFVAVAASGTGTRVMTSTDGITWTSQSSASDESWQDVTFGNGLFVAVASTGTSTGVMSSVDGENWVTRVPSEDNQWYSVISANGLFVAVSRNGTNRVMTSPDAVTWTARSAAAANSWNAVTYGNGLFVAVAFTGTNDRVMTSPDGITWTSRTNPVDNQWSSIAYGNGLFASVSFDGTGDRVMTSPDGIVWTVRESSIDNVFHEVRYVGTMFVAVAATGTGTRVMTSGVMDAIIQPSNLPTFGTLSPILEDGAAGAPAGYTTQNCFWMRIGNRYFLSYEIVITGIGTLSGIIRIGGFGSLGNVDASKTGVNYPCTNQGYGGALTLSSSITGINGDSSLRISPVNYDNGDSSMFGLDTSDVAGSLRLSGFCEFYVSS